jgi:hypothetical protein
MQYNLGMIAPLDLLLSIARTPMSEAAERASDA